MVSEAVMSGLQGCNILHGAMMGALAAGQGQVLGRYGGRMRTGARLAVVAVVGGTVAELGGGKFANGAMTAAFAFLFNELKHEHSNDTPEGIEIANEAKDNIGNDRWGKNKSPIGSSKCNIFVQDILKELGYYTGNYLSAGEWGNPNVDIDGWVQISVDEIGCGDVAAYKNRTNDATGHMGIMFFSNSLQKWTLIYAGSSSHPNQIVRSLFFTPSINGGKSWFDKYHWVFRRYVGTK